MFLPIGNEPFRSSKCATVGESQRNYQNGYCGAEGTSVTSVVPRKQIICKCSKMLSPRVWKLSVPKFFLLSIVCDLPDVIPKERAVSY
ncbi:hypothetical protein AVEN_189231-1 [Araneus ventricosus]|uniref:Uncharacterized protein n=1 Tax=Araneus ventricosus TaxID=182803 RepID=A0A4Y2PZ84_ARAVE|nr:hypothetical protein AVEN_189231-1 [Araneus ventricosus]